MPFFYHSGQEIKLGDRVMLHGKPGIIDDIADPTLDPANGYVTKYGGGVMVHEPENFGHLFDDDPSHSEDLEFVSRAESYCSQPPPSAM